MAEKLEPAAIARIEVKACEAYFDTVASLLGAKSAYYEVDQPITAVPLYRKAQGQLLRAEVRLDEITEQNLRK